MLQTIRDRASGWIAYIIIILISIPFALWGIQEYLGGSDPRLAAEVNGQAISVQLFNREFQQQKRYLQSMIGGQLPPQYSDVVLRENALQRVVRNELLRQELDGAGYHVADKVLFEQLSSIPSFSNNGVFDKKRYELVLQSQRRTMVEFERDLRQQIRVSQFIEGISNSAFLPNSSVNDYLRLKHQQRDVAYFVVPADKEQASAEIEEGDVQSYFDAHKERYQTSERVKLSYLELKEQELIESIEVKEDILRQVYEEQAELYTNPEQRRARHILLKTPLQNNDETDLKKLDEIRQRAEELVANLRSGGDFAALAKEFSDDVLSASSGGELGFIVRGDMDPSLEKALFNLGIDQISDPIKTDKGFQILQLLEITAEQRRDYDEVRDQIALDHQQRSAESQFLELAEQLLTLSYEQPDSLAPAAEALALDIKDTDWITRMKGEGLGSHAKIRMAAFLEEVLTQGRNSDLVELVDGHVVVIRVNEHELAKLKPLDEVREEIRLTLIADKARDQAASQGAQAIAELATEADPVAVAQKFGNQLQEFGWVKRDDKKVPNAILNKAFVFEKPQSSAPTVGGVQLTNGDYAVILVKAVQENGQVEKDLKTVEMQQSSGYGNRELEATFKAMEAGADVRIVRENIDGP
ncbi:MAG: peptidylprolyl isomerase [Gammaproteobacteria bacterium]|nr:peptidylprolyl isomerase [Gammaproteobacteria bacterium]